MPEKILLAWLQSLGYTVSKALLELQLKSHPDFPTLRSITDTLDYFNIDNAAVEIEKDQLHEIDTPFLAHLLVNGGEFVIVSNRDTLEQTYPGFFENWQGVVVVAERSEEWNHKENAQWLRKERKENTVRSVVAGLLLSFTICAGFFAVNWASPLLLIIALAGIFISWLISTKEQGTANKIADKICGKNDDCGAVIDSTKSKLLFGITWGDIGLIWFCSLLIAVSASILTVNNSGMIYLLSLFAAASVAFIFYSVYYQWRVEKKWCRLCLITVALLCAQLAVLFTTLTNDPLEKLVLTDALLFLGIITAVSTTWFSYKQVVVQNNKLNDEVLEGIKLKRNEVTMQALLEGKREAETSPWEYDLQIGNPLAPLQVMVACGTHCMPCARKHEILHEIIENYGDKMGLTIRFAFQANNKNETRTRSVEYILQYITAASKNMANEQKILLTRDVLHQWFKIMDLEKFRAKYPCNEYSNVDDILITHEEWVNKNRIEFTPTIFINGKQLPMQYKIEDIPWLIPIVNYLEIRRTEERSASMISIPV